MLCKNASPLWLVQSEQPLLICAVSDGCHATQRCRSQQKCLPVTVRMQRLHVQGRQPLARSCQAGVKSIWHSLLTHASVPMRMPTMHTMLASQTDSRHGLCTPSVNKWHLVSACSSVLCHDSKVQRQPRIVPQGACSAYASVLRCVLYSQI